MSREELLARAKELTMYAAAETERLLKLAAQRPATGT
jgi:hypothetical protein